MNIKFFLTIALSLGCVIVLFLWYSANGLYKESQLYEKQFLFKISTLESENKMELKLINSLRVEIAKNDEDLKIKTNLLETMRNKEKSRDEERESLQKNIENVKIRYETVNKESNMWVENWKIESQNKSESDRNKIKHLEDELQLLKLEYNRLTQLIPPKQIVAKSNDAPSKSNKNKNDGLSSKPIIVENKNGTSTIKKADQHVLDEPHDIQSKKGDSDSQIRQARPPKIEKSNINQESAKVNPMTASESIITKEDKDKKDNDFHLVKNSNKDDEGKLKPKGKEDENSAGDRQLKKPKPFEKSKPDENDLIQNLLLNKDDTNINKRIANPKILKKEVDHQVRPPIAINKIDKSNDRKPNNSIGHDDVMNVLNKPDKKM